MQKKYLAGVLFLIACWGHIPARASDNTVHIIATDWGLTLKANGTGFYNDLARFVLPPSIGPVNYEILPYKRAKRLFLRDRNTCLFPSNVDYLHQSGTIASPEGFIGARPVVFSQTHLFSRLGTTPPGGPEDLGGKRIAYALGSDVINMLKPAQAFFIAVPDETDKAQMLIEGRIDLLIADLPDAKFVFDELGVPVQAYNHSFNLSDAETGVVCHRSPRHEAFVAAFNSNLDALTKSGELETFFRAQGLDPAAHMPRQE